MANKVYIPNLVINEISDSLIEHITDQVGNNLTVDPTNLAKLNETNAFTGLNTFTTLPQSEATPTDNKDLATKKYVDDTANNKVSKTGPETIEGVKTFSSIPLCSHQPTNGHQLANKDYVDSVVVGGDISNFAKLDTENTFTQENHFSQISANSIVSVDKLNMVSTVGVNIGAQLGVNDYRQIDMTDAHGIQITSTDDNHTAQVSVSPSGAGVVFNDRAIGIDNKGSSNSNRILMSHTPIIITPTEWATMADNEVPTKKQILDNVQGGGGGGDSIPLSISSQMATYDTTALNSVKWDFGNDTYSMLGTNEIDFTTKTSRLDKTSNVIIGDAGCYAIPDELIPLFGDSLKEMGSIPIGLNVMNNNSNIGGLGIGGNGNASVLWGGGTRNFLAIGMNQVILSGDSVSGNAGLSIVNGVMVFNSPISFNFNLDDSGTLIMSPKMISELKRLLGIS